MTQKEMAKKYSDGYSYLSWPCSVDGNPDLHITAKFFGQQAVTREQILDLIGDIPIDVDANDIDWKAEEFDTPNDGKVKVLRLMSYPGNMVEIHYALAPLRKDDYDRYKPHVTVPEEIWNKVKGDGDSPVHVGPVQLDLKIGALMLSNQGEEIKI